MSAEGLVSCWNQQQPTTIGRPVVADQGLPSSSRPVVPHYLQQASIGRPVVADKCYYYSQVLLQQQLLQPTLYCTTCTSFLRTHSSQLLVACATSRLLLKVFNYWSTNTDLPLLVCCYQPGISSPPLQVCCYWSSTTGLQPVACYYQSVDTILLPKFSYFELSPTP